MIPADEANLTDYGKNELDSYKAQFGDERGEERFWNSRLLNDGTLKSYDGVD